MPSLTQLNEAVLAYRAEHPDVRITVVVDATFGHRIAKSEAAEFDAAVSNNELVAPPAGAVGRGDAFVLGIANKANATVLSNDSFQEFHGQYTWLFDEGRLVGGKPVPHVGWVFVERTPVRGPVSRKAVRESKHAAPAEARRRSRGRPAAPADATTPAATSSTSTDVAAKKASRQASMPMPVPTKPPPGRAVANDGVNELMPFLEFVERHPVGTSVNAVVDSYSSHGAYVRIGDVKGYVPLRMMGDPPPRSAREVVKVGDAVTLVVASFAPARRSIDLSMPQVPMDGGGSAGDAAAEAVVDAVAPPPVTARRGRGRTADAGSAQAHAQASAPAPAAEAPARKRAAKSTGSERRAASTPPLDAPPATGPAEHTPAHTPAKRAPAKKAASKRAPTKQAARSEAATRDDPAAGSAPAAKTEPAVKKQPAARKSTAATTAPATKKVPAAKAPENVVAKKPAAKAATKKAPAKQAAQRRRVGTPETS